MLYINLCNLSTTNKNVLPTATGILRLRQSTQIAKRQQLILAIHVVILIFYIYYVFFLNSKYFIIVIKWLQTTFAS